MHPRVVSSILFSPRGGSSHAARALARELPGSGWSVTLVAGSRSGPDSAQDARSFYAPAGDLHVVDFAAALEARDPLFPPDGVAPLHPSYEDRPGAPDAVFASLDDDAFERQVRAWSTALRTVEAAGADVLHLHHLTPINEAAARVAPEVPVVAHLHGTEMLMLEAIRAGETDWPYASVWEERMLGWAEHATRVVVPTPRGAARAADTLGVAPERVEIIAGGVDERQFTPGVVDRRAVWRGVLGDDDDAVDALADGVVLLFVGRFTAVKRVPLLIEAFAQARERLGDGVSLVIVGGYPGETEGEHPSDAIARVGAQGIHLAGWQDQRLLPDLLRASDATILPSVRESFGQVVVESMACGRPAIAIDRGGPADIVDDGTTGWLVEPDDRDALSAAIVEVATEPQERERRGALAREAVLERFTWRAAAQELARVFEEASVDRGHALAG